MANLVSIIIKRFEKKTMDAYSYKRYGSIRWRNAIKVLLRHYDTEQTEVILRSKVMRTAADWGEDRKGIPGDLMERWLRMMTSRKMVVDLLIEANSEVKKHEGGYLSAEYKNA